MKPRCRYSYDLRAWLPVLRGWTPGQPYGLGGLFRDPDGDLCRIIARFP